MKKVDSGYAIKWYGGLAALLIIGLPAVFVLYGISDFFLILPVGTLLVFFGLFAGFKQMDKNLASGALALEDTFSEQGFDYQYKFTSNTGVFYIDTSGRLGVVWKHNPTQLQFADLSKVSDIRVHDGKQLRGTALVSCRFRLDGKPYKIYTLRVSNGQLSMNAPEVVEAIAKAKKLCEMLSLAQQNALRGASPSAV